MPPPLSDPESPVDESEVDGPASPLEVVVEEPVERLSSLAAEQVACTIRAYLDLTGEDRGLTLVDGYGEPYVGVGS